MKLISLEAITRALNEGGVRFIVVGGLAVNAQEEYDLSVTEEVAPDVPIRIVRYPTLLQMKRDAGRAQDLADIEELRLLREHPRDD